MIETPEERARESARSEAALRMGWAAQLDDAIHHIRSEIARAYTNPSVSPRDRVMHDAQLSYAIRILQKSRDEYAEEALRLWPRSFSPATLSTPGLEVQSESVSSPESTTPG